MASEAENNINRINAQLQETLKLLRELKTASIANQGGVVSDKEIQAQKELNRLIKERRGLLAGGKNTGTNIPRPAGVPAPSPNVDPSDIASKIAADYKILAGKDKQTATQRTAINRRQNEILTERIKFLQEGNLVEQEGTKLSRKLLAKQRVYDEKVAATKATPVDESVKIEQDGAKLSRKLLAQQRTADAKSVVAKEKKAKANEEEAREAQRQANLRAKIANDPALAQFKEQLRARGFTDENSRYSAENRGSSITKYSASRRDQSGGDNKFTGFVNEKTGVSTPGLSSQFRSFGSDILRDIGQFTKWSIAVAAVYTPLQKLGELITVMISNESELADAAIAANLPFEKSGEIFDSVAIAAEGAGESINTTIDAYAQATRAAGRYTEEQGKSQKATQLLSDSLILSKLSTLDQSQSIDTLSAALLQSDRELDQGQELLNKWVRISQIANVGIDGLAVGVAVLGDAAETSGLDIDHLNGLIAVLSEQSISGSKEAANTAKALIGSYQSDKSEQVLSRYGIALRKTNGEVRSFLSVYQDLANLKKQGILSDPAVSELALALGGGGVRRAKDASALINSQDRLNELAAESAKISGDSTLAQDSLAKKLETVETATTRLGNAWQELAQTLGDDGGMLDMFKNMINLLTGITSAADDLFTLLGRSGPILATFATGLLALRSIKPGTRETLLAGLGANPTGFQGFLGGQAQYANAGKQGLASNILQQTTKGGAAIGGAAVGLSAISNLAAGNNKQALANIGGGIAGAVIGTMIAPGGGTAIGAIIGSSAAEAMTNSIVNYKPQWEDFFVNVTKDVKPEEDAPITDKEGLVAEAARQSKVPEWFARFAAFSFNTIPDRIIDAKIRKDTGGQKQFTGEDITALNLQLNNAPQEYKDRIAKQKELETVKSGQLLPAEEAKYKQLSLELEKQATAEKEKQLKLLSEGKITPAEYGKKSEQLTGFPSVAIQSVEAYGEQFINVSKDIDNTKEAYEAFLFVAANGNAEQIAALGQYSTDIRTLEYVIKNFDKKSIGTKLSLTFGDVTIESVDQLQKILSGFQASGASAANRTVTDIKFQQLKEPPIVGDITKPDTQKNINLNIQKGTEYQNQFFEFLRSTGVSADEIERLTANIEPFAVALKDGENTIFQTVGGLRQSFYDLGAKANEAAGALDEIQKIGFQKFDVDRATLERLASQSLALGTSWSTPVEQGGKGFNYDFKPEDQIAIDNQGIVQPLHADFKILALLLEKLNEKAQKQLDGQYNIPEGATFWVPLTAAYYRNKGGDEAGGINDMLAGLELDGNTAATDQNTGALAALTTKLGEIGVDKFMMKNTLEGTKDGGTRQSVLDRKSEEAGYGISSVIRPRLSVLDRKSEEAGLGPIATQQGSQVQELLATLKQGLTQLLLGFNGGVGQFIGAGASAGSGTGSKGGGINTRIGGAQNAPVSPTTKLDLKVSSNVNLMVDGRVLASVLQNYLASELLRTEQSQGTVSKRFVI